MQVLEVANYLKGGHLPWKHVPQWAAQVLSTLENPASVLFSEIGYFPAGWTSLGNLGEIKIGPLRYFFRGYVSIALGQALAEARKQGVKDPVHYRSANLSYLDPDLRTQMMITQERFHTLTNHGIHNPQELVYVKCREAFPVRGQPDWFVGESLEAILRATKDGTGINDVCFDHWEVRPSKEGEEIFKRSHPHLSEVVGRGFLPVFRFRLLEEKEDEREGAYLEARRVTENSRSKIYLCEAMAAGLLPGLSRPVSLSEVSRKFSQQYDAATQSILSGETYGPALVEEEPITKEDHLSHILAAGVSKEELETTGLWEFLARVERQKEVTKNPTFIVHDQEGNPYFMKQVEESREAAEFEAGVYFHGPRNGQQAIPRGILPLPITTVDNRHYLLVEFIPQTSIKPTIAPVLDVLAWYHECMGPLLQQEGIDLPGKKIWRPDCYLSEEQGVLKDLPLVSLDRRLREGRAFHEKFQVESEDMVLLHNDLQPVHFRGSKILDWGNGAYGHPSIDLAGAFVSLNMPKHTWPALCSWYKQRRSYWAKEERHLPELSVAIDHALPYVVQRLQAGPAARMRHLGVTLGTNQIGRIYQLQRSLHDMQA